MRKTIFTLLSAFAFLLAAQTVSAQTVSKGAWMIGGTAGFSSTKFKSSDNSVSMLNISPSIGLYVIDDLAVGLGLSYASVSFDGDSESSTSLSPFVRYYVVNPIFLQAGVDLGLDEGSGMAVNAALGYSWFLNDNVAIEPQLFYQNFNRDGEVGDFSTFGLAIGIQAFIGR